MASLKPCSFEQLAVINAIAKYNVSVDAVAGSGKTTTCLHICKYYPKERIQLVTYNKRLKEETRDRVNKHKITNISVESYHSFTVKHYDKNGYTDTVVEQVIKSNAKPLDKFAFDILIIDEIQDIQPLYYALINKIIKNNRSNYSPRIVIFGDRNQCIYNFKLADARYLTLAHNIFNFNNLQWQSKLISCSFRITTQMADFINNCMLKNKRLVANKSGIKPIYLMTNLYAGTIPMCKACDSCVSYDDGCYIHRRKYKYFKPVDEQASYLLKILKYYISLGYTAGDIFIITPSVQSLASPARTLANFITKYITNCEKTHPNYEIYKNYPIYVPASDNDIRPSDEVTKGKIIFSTYHQAKGLERKVVIVMGFDESYYKFNGRTETKVSCPNIFYVAATRATERLVLVHQQGNDYLPFLNTSMLSTYSKVIGNYKYKEHLDIPPPLERSVTELLSHVFYAIIDNAYDRLKITNIAINNDKISINTESKQPYGTEEVSEITGTAIPAYLEFKINGRCSIFEEIKEQFIFKKKTDVDDEQNDNEYDDNYTEIDVDISTTDDYYDYIGVCDLPEEETDYKFTEVSTVAEPEVKKVKVVEPYHDAFQSFEAFSKLLNSDDDLKTNKLLYVAIKYNACISKYQFKTVQIKWYNWLSNDTLTASYERCKKLNISPNAIFEHPLVSIVDVCINNVNTNVIVSGRADCIDGYNIYEFKCTKSNSKEHFLQLAIYMFMHRVELAKKYADDNKIEYDDTPDCEIINITPITELSKYHYYLYNILNDNLYELACTNDDLCYIVKKLIEEKYIVRKVSDDEQFIINNKSICKSI